MSDARDGRSSGGLIPGLVKGLATTARSLTRRHHTVEYPDVKPQLPPRSRGVIALTEENCTSCMLCARECPDWCIYIDSHKEEIPASTPGGRARQRNVLDRFAIDFSLCMYCGICIEVCPFDALHWSPEFEYSETDIRNLLHEKDRLGEWMATVPPPPALDPGSPDPAELTALSRPARPAAPAAPASRATTVRRAAPGTVSAEPTDATGPSEASGATEPAQPTGSARPRPVRPDRPARATETAAPPTPATPDTPEAPATPGHAEPASSTEPGDDASPPPPTSSVDQTARSDEARTRVMPAVDPQGAPSRPEPAQGTPDAGEPAGNGDTKEFPAPSPESPSSPGSTPTVQLPTQRPSGEEQ